ncbi:hypothetical protein OAI02_06595 [Candidatus Pseudothioglobus singularis]|nr:hypothetical protein [Candidatus Pseudothioglobus singularis]MDB4848145.1 hypothetical protein [Candidatus Pseudothioglobus singularis]
MVKTLNYTAFISAENKHVVPLPSSISAISMLSYHFILCLWHPNQSSSHKITLRLANAISVA